ncbi:thiamine pyrophosphate-binding protein [Nonomuraea typhae]|uniref:thiamine pyrophosphate-binding protein n=1 Tax=Nonomuraea typhae TaxID=2603600 RepID=UPI0012F725B9|nr:thiamine pyrophosphate-binding protein [Nonomuraea typhae]
MSGAVSGGEAVVRALAEHGVDTVFGIPGTHNLEIYRHLPAYRVRHVLTRHEQGAGYAADGYARACGRPGVVLVTSGPATLNAAAAIGQAYSDSIPVLLISPGMPLRSTPGAGLLHETRDQSRAMDSVAAYSHRVTSVAGIPVALARAFAVLTSGRARPVHLEIPLDVLVERSVVISPGPVAVPVTVPPDDMIAAAAQVLGAARAPLMIVGGGARWAAPQVRMVAERLGAAVVTTANGKGVLPDDHPLALGAGMHLPAVAEIARRAGAVLVVGSELAPSDLWHGPLEFTGPVVRVDADPAQLVTNAVPDVALAGDAAATLDRLLALLDPVPGRGAAAEVAAAEVARWRAIKDGQAMAEGGRWRWIVRALAEGVGRGGIVAGDSAMICYYGALTGLPAYGPSRFLHPTGYGTLGYGLPAAMGAAVALPGRAVAALMGDGGVMFTIAELAAAAQLGLALPVVVVDNGGYGEIRAEMVSRQDPVQAVELPSPDFVMLARSLGAYGVRAGDEESLTAAVKEALAADRPTLVHVRETPLANVEETP